MTPSHFQLVSRIDDLEQEVIALKASAPLPRMNRKRVPRVTPHVSQIFNALDGIHNAEVGLTAKEIFARCIDMKRSACDATISNMWANGRLERDETVFPYRYWRPVELKP